MKIEFVALSALIPGDAINSRKHGRSAGVAALAASIKAIGLQQPLRVRPAGDDRFEIVDGNTRFEALKKISGKKSIDVPVCIVEQADADAHAASLAANVIRTPLHPVDEFESFRRLQDEGTPVDKIAANFAIGVADVLKTLQLSELAPEVREAWKAGKIDARQAQAFSCHPDQERQKTVLKTILKSRDEWTKNPDAIRRSMLDGRIGGRDRRVLFVGLDAYREAGGTFVQDLFKDEFTLGDGALLDRLVAEKIDAAAKVYIAEGWAWAAPESALDFRAWDAPLLDLRPWMQGDEAAIYAKAKYEYERRNAAEPAFSRALADPEARKQSGVILSVNYEGELDPKFLRLKPAPIEADDDAGNEEGSQEDEGSTAPAEEPAPAEKPRISQALHESLAETMTKAASAAIAHDHFVALCLVTATLKSSLTSYNDRPLRISTAAWHGLGVALREDGSWVEIFQEFLAMDQARVLIELAQIASKLIDLTDKKFDSSRGADWKKSRSAIVQAIAAVLPAGTFNEALQGLFMPADYFAAVTGATLDRDVIEMGSPPPKGKKPEKVEAAKALAIESGWLPPELRTAHYQGPGRAEG